MHTAFVQVSLKEDHKIGSYEYMARVKKRMQTELPELTAYFQSGGMVDAVLNLGLPAPIDVQVAGSNMDRSYETALKLSAKIRTIPGVADVFTPQDVDYPALQLDVDRMRASEMGLSQQEVVDNIITALTSNTMIAPSFWIDPKTGNDYMLTVQYPENQVKNLDRPEGDSAARVQSKRTHATGHGQQHPAGLSRPRKWTITRSGAPSTFTCGRSTKIWGGSPTRSTASSRRPRCPQV